MTEIKKIKTYLETIKKKNTKRKNVISKIYTKIKKKGIDPLTRKITNINELIEKIINICERDDLKLDYIKDGKNEKIHNIEEYLETTHRDNVNKIASNLGIMGSTREPKKQVITRILNIIKDDVKYTLFSGADFHVKIELTYNPEG